MAHRLATVVISSVLVAGVGVIIAPQAVAHPVGSGLAQDPSDPGGGDPNVPGSPPPPDGTPKGSVLDLNQPEYGPESGHREYQRMIPKVDQAGGEGADMGRITSAPN